MMEESLSLEDITFIMQCSMLLSNEARLGLEMIKMGIRKQGERIIKVTRN